jgi:hypothetical protein
MGSNPSLRLARAVAALVAQNRGAGAGPRVGRGLPGRNFIAAVNTNFAELLEVIRRTCFRAYEVTVEARYLLRLAFNSKKQGETLALLPNAEAAEDAIEEVVGVDGTDDLAELIESPAELGRHELVAGQLGGGWRDASGAGAGQMRCGSGEAFSAPRGRRADHAGIERARGQLPSDCDS